MYALLFQKKAELIFLVIEMDKKMEEQMKLIEILESIKSTGKCKFLLFLPKLKNNIE